MRPVNQQGALEISDRSDLSRSFLNSEVLEKNVEAAGAEAEIIAEEGFELGVGLGVHLMIDAVSASKAHRVVEKIIRHIYGVFIDSVDIVGIIEAVRSEISVDIVLIPAVVVYL